MNFRTRFRIVMGIFVMVMFAGMTQCRHASAASAMIEFSLNEDSVKEGDTFTVLMNLSSTDVISSVDVYVSYDASYMEFVSGGRYVSGNSGLLHVNATDIESGKTHVKFSLQFKAVTTGSCAVNISDEAVVTGADGKAMSTSSNRISVGIKSKSNEKPDDNAVQAPPSYIPASSDNKLLSLKVSDGILEPMFDSDKTKYSLTVDNTVEDLCVSFKASDSDAVVTLQGNEELKEGSNTVKVIVKAPNGAVKEYKIKVKKETYAETEERLKGEKEDTSGIQFGVKNENGKVYLQNSYKYEIVDVDESTQVPAGYTKTSVLLYGVNVTAYTVSSNLDSDYLIMYCMNENGDCDFYQFDRQEKSLQRYTGELVDRINASEGNVESEEVMTSHEYRNNLSQLAIIIAILAGVSVMLIIALISVMLKQVKSKSKRIEDELDF